MNGGATAAECVVREGDEFSTLVRLGQVETLKESGSRSIGVRVFHGQRSASTYSSDFSREGLDRMLKSALELAKITSEDPFGGIPEASQLGSLSGDLDLYPRTSTRCPAKSASTTRAAPKRPRSITIRASRIPKADRSMPPPATKFWQTRTDSSASTAVLIARWPPCPSRRRKMAPCSAITGSRWRATWAGSTRPKKWADRRPTHPAPPGRTQSKNRAGSRGLRSHGRDLHSRHIFEGINGDSVYRGASFLAGKLGEKIAGDHVTVIDDGTMVGGFGTSPFDGEGIPTRRTVVIENGVFKSYLLNTYTAKKLGLQTTGNASRGLAGTPGIGPGNYFLQPGAKTPKEIIADIPEGLYVTEFLGHGANLVTGDYSRGASGLWIPAAN